MIRELALTVACAGGVALAAPAPSERTDYRQTPTYAETMAYLQDLSTQSEWIHLDTFGVTPLGRPMHVVVVSADRAFDPESAARTGKLVVLIQNGIHSGEIDGKDACLELVRDLAVTRERAALLEHVVLVIIPVFNIDGHEVRSPYNRINQNGPAEMGFRATSQNYNLNRDYMKLDAPELRAWVALWNRWDPAFFIDNHVTDGADFQYAITYTITRHPNSDRDVAAWGNQVFVPEISRRMQELGEPIFPYVVTGGGPLRAGLFDWVEDPRFSTGYAGIRNRPGLLVEMHMLKDYGRRVRANYLFMVAVLELLNRRPDALRSAVAAADRRAVLGQEETIALEFVRTPEADTVDFRGYEYDSVHSEITGGTWIRYDRARPVTMRVPYFGRMQATLEVSLPWAYIIPPPWTDVIERLRLHGVEMQVLGAQELEVERYRLHRVRWEAESYEGHHRVSCSTSVESARVFFPRGSVLVTTRQARSRLVVHLLEPGAPDSFLRWGFFDTILEQKEYAEDYAAESLAVAMVRDPTTRREFDSLVAADSLFARSPDARRDFFYKRSPFAEPELRVYPVARLPVEVPVVREPAP
jgi:hypothetical protein